MRKEEEKKKRKNRNSAIVKGLLRQVKDPGTIETKRQEGPYGSFVELFHGRSKSFVRELWWRSDYIWHFFPFSACVLLKVRIRRRVNHHTMPWQSSTCRASTCGIFTTAWAERWAEIWPPLWPLHRGSCPRRRPRPVPTLPDPSCLKRKPSTWPRSNTPLLPPPGPLSKSTRRIR